MSPQDTAFSYHQMAAVGASPVDQVVALYDRILRDFHRGVAAVAAGEIEKRVESANHALTVIAELQSVLDFAKGEEAAQNLNNFYNVARAMVTQAGMANSPEKFKELIGMFSRMRTAWAKVARAEGTPQASSSPRAHPVAPLRGVSANHTTPIGDRKPTSTGRWSG